MPIPRAVARLNRGGLNRPMRLLAARAPGFGVVVHVGRRSGRSYETPVNVFRTSQGVRIALTYGPDSDWVRNVLAVGGCRLLTGGREVTLTRPRLVHDPSRAHVGPVVAGVLGVLDVTDFLDLAVQERSTTR